MIVASAEERIKSELRDSVVVVPEIQYLAQASSPGSAKNIRKTKCSLAPINFHTALQYASAQLPLVSLNVRHGSTTSRCSLIAFIRVRCQRRQFVAMCQCVTERGARISEQQCCMDGYGLDSWHVPIKLHSLGSLIAASISWIFQLSPSKQTWTLSSDTCQMSSQLRAVQSCTWQTCRSG